MSAVLTFKEVRCAAMRERRTIETLVMLANDDIALVRFGPRGGHKVLRTT